MNDYKELIDELRFLFNHVPEQMCDDDGKDALIRAVETIEELERKLYNANNEIKMLKSYMKREGISVIPGKYPWSKTRWNV